MPRIELHVTNQKTTATMHVAWGRSDMAVVAHFHGNGRLKCCGPSGNMGCPWWTNPTVPFLKGLRAASIY